MGYYEATPGSAEDDLVVNEARYEMAYAYGQRGPVDGMMMIIASFCPKISRHKIDLSDLLGPVVASFDSLWTPKLREVRVNRTDSWPYLTDLEFTVHKDGVIPSLRYHYRDR